MGTLIVHRDEPLSSFHNIDAAFGAILEIGVRPFVELSFMPWCLASGDTSVFANRSNVTPPKSYRAWATLIRRLVGHLVERFGAAEVRRWYFEVWNEPNLKAFWTGTQAEYFALYRHTVEAIRGVDAELRVGGPSSAQNAWIPEFLDFCDRENLPVDFVTTHHYPTDAFGQPGDDTVTQLSKSRRSALRDEAAQARRETGARPLLYTEWNSSSNPGDPLHDEPYAAAFVAKTVLEAAEIVDGYAFWVFSDIFAETYYPAVPFHGGFGLLTLHGIPKPTFRVFEVLHGLGTERLPVTGAHATVDAWVVREPGGLTVVCTNHALPRHPITAERVRIALTGAPQPRAASCTRIDADHANPKRFWEEEMGAPGSLRPMQVEHLREVSRPRRESLAWRHEGDTLWLECTLPPHGVAALAVEWAEPPRGAA